MYHTAGCYFICTVILFGIFLCILGSLEGCGLHNVHHVPLPKIYVWCAATFWFLNVEGFSRNSRLHNSQPFQNAQIFFSHSHLSNFSN